MASGPGQPLGTVVTMWLAGIPIADQAVLQLATTLHDAELLDTAELLERAYDREARIVALDVHRPRGSPASARGVTRAAGDASPGARLAAVRGSNRPR